MCLTAPVSSAKPKPNSEIMTTRLIPFLVFVCVAAAQTATPRLLKPEDVHRVIDVRDPQVSPDGAWVAYTISTIDKAAEKSDSDVWMVKWDGSERVRLTTSKESESSPRWSPDGKWLAFLSSRANREEGTQVWLLPRAGGEATQLTSVKGSVNDYVWSPDSKSIVFVSATPGPETAAATGDPVVITRYLYKPDYEEGMTRFNDNRRTHLFLVDVATGAVRQLTSGDFYEHSPDWSPDGREVLFVSNREPNQDQFFNYDIFAFRLAGGAIRRITATESAEFQPRYSPDGKRIVFLGTRRGLRNLETNMEDTHVWVMNADGSGRREIGKAIDNRQNNPGWSVDGKSAIFTVLDCGDVKLCRLPADGGEPEWLHAEPGRVDDWSVAGDTLAYTFSSPSDMAQVYLRKEGGPARRMTGLNDAILKERQVAAVEAFTFVSNDNRHEIQAFLTKPLGLAADSKHPLIVSIHGGPHAQNGRVFTFKDQAYAALGWAVLHVNYRGSAGYGQSFADAVFADQNGNEGQDVLYGVSAALRRYLWIDRERMGIEGTSYGGQLTAWLVTQTNWFKAAIPIAPITNLVSYNYMTYYNQYEQMEWGIFPHQGDLMDTLWKRSPLRYVARVRTPVMLLHGENDSDVPIAETEQFYIALKDVGVETVMLRYPREGHVLSEPVHVVDIIERSVAWYRRHFETRPR